MSFSILSRSAFAAALLLMASGATAQTAVFSGDTSGGPTFNRTIVCGSLSGIGTAVAYEAMSFTTDTSGSYDFSSVQTGYDGYLFLYSPSFDPGDAQANCVIGDDDGAGGIGTSDFTTALTAGTTYVLVATGFDNLAFGPYSGTIDGPPGATITFDGAPGVTIEYLGSTDDPQRDDFVFIRALATNSSASVIRTRVYFEVEYPNGADRTYSVLSSDFPGNSSFQVQQITRMKLPIPVDAPEGTYTVTIYAADDIANGGTIYDSDTFTFDLGPIITPKTGELASGVDAGPNPFFSSTTIRYELAESAEVDLRVFDVTGRQVATLATGTMSPGTHSALFSAGDLPGGVYVWRLAVGGEVTTGRVTLAR